MEGIDFHALRHSCASFLVDAGVDPKTCQELMRHSTVELTLGRYSHVYRGKTSEAVAMLPDFTRTKETEQLKTGTDNQPVNGPSRSAFCSDKFCGNNQKNRKTMGDIEGSLVEVKNTVLEAKTAILGAKTGLGRGGFEPPTHGFPVRFGVL